MQNRLPNNNYNHWVHNTLRGGLQEKAKSEAHWGWVTAWVAAFSPLDGVGIKCYRNPYLKCLCFLPRKATCGLGMGSKCRGHYTNSSYHSTCDLFPTNDDYLLFRLIQVWSGVTDIRPNCYQPYWQMLPCLNSHKFHMCSDQANNSLRTNCSWNETNILYKCIIEDICNNSMIPFTEAYPTGIFKLLIVLMIKN